MMSRYSSSVKARRVSVRIAPAELSDRANFAAVSSDSEEPGAQRSNKPNCGDRVITGHDSREIQWPVRVRFAFEYPVDSLSNRARPKHRHIRAEQLGARKLVLVLMSLDELGLILD